MSQSVLGARWWLAVNQRNSGRSLQFAAMGFGIWGYPLPPPTTMIAVRDDPCGLQCYMIKLICVSNIPGMFSPQGGS